jgi:hypothetical protein
MGNSIEEKSEALSYVIFSVWTASFKHLIKEGFLQHVSLETFAKVYMEFLLLYLNLSDREIFQQVEIEERDKIMHLILKDITKRLEKYDEVSLTKLVGEQTSKNLSQYFTYWSKIAYSNNFINVYNKSQIDYSVCKEIAPSKDESPKDTVLWEFGKKVSTIVLGHPEDIVIIMHSNILAMEMFKALLKLILQIFTSEKK